PPRLAPVPPATFEPQKPTENTAGVLRSVLANWAGEAVWVIMGFFLPRLIDQRMSRDELGIWDYGWSIRSYVAYADIGLGSGGGHYVVRYRERRRELTHVLGAMLALLI